MARIRTSSHQVTQSFCGACGKILSKNVEIFDNCPKCNEVVEA